MSQPPNQRIPTLEEFDRLIDGLIAGASRSHYWPWEIELLLDISEVPVRAFGDHAAVLRRYQEAVRAEWAAGKSQPRKLSEHLDRERLKTKMRSNARWVDRDKSA